MSQPTWGDLVPLRDADWATLPDTTTPYYVATKTGTYLHRRTVLGRGLVPTTKTPPVLQAIETKGGEFTWDAAAIPATIYAQAVDFFARVWRTHKTEAEVLITREIASGAYRLFVPTQRVSHGGVHSIYDPRHIKAGWMVVGTFHSHCDFSPYHSSTDEADASEMDGLHGTIGYLDRAEPELALMMALNGVLFHYKVFDGVVDTTDLAAASAPAWWDRYLVFGEVTDADRTRLAPYADDAAWDRFMGRTRKPVILQKTWTPPAYTWQGYRPWSDAHGSENIVPFRPKEPVYSGILRESRRFNAKNQPDYWEDALGSAFVDALFATGLFSEEDYDAAIEDWPASGTQAYWDQRVLERLVIAANYLRGRNYAIEVTFPSAPTTQTSLDEYLGGAQA